MAIVFAQTGRPAEDHVAFRLCEMAAILEGKPLSQGLSRWARLAAAERRVPMDKTYRIGTTVKDWRKRVKRDRPQRKDETAAQRQQLIDAGLLKG